MKRVLIANRGEIAVRVIESCRALGIETIAVFSEADASAPHVRAADHAVLLGPAPASESYLDIEKVLAAGRERGADAVHPGYGFLSENAEFARRVEQEGWTFIGPTAESIESMGDKIRAIELARSASVPTVPSATLDDASDVQKVQSLAQEIGFPILIKAAAGGGGKGMRVARSSDELGELAEAATREATNAFGDGRVFLERYLENARHIEVQVVGDGNGRAVALGERDCSIQRRHQKIVEEAPAPGLTDEERAAFHNAAVSLAETTKYRGAGTVEFIRAASGEFFFLEMNTRLQVEHPVTECVFGVDLVAVQLEVARSGRLPDGLDSRSPQGHAIEIRVYAENPATGFLPSTGTLSEVVWPTGAGVRVDSGIERGLEVTSYYDPMLAKIIATGVDRDAAIRRTARALSETFVAGVETNLGFCRELIVREDFVSGDVSTTFIADRIGDQPTHEPSDFERAAGLLATKIVTEFGSAAGSPESPSGPPPVWSTLTAWRGVDVQKDGSAH